MNFVLVCVRLRGLAGRSSESEDWSAANHFSHTEVETRKINPVPLFIRVKKLRVLCAFAVQSFFKSKTI